MSDKTIAAISTPLGPGGIGIIRISGPDAYRILNKLFVRKNAASQKRKNSASDIPLSSHVVYYGFILHPLSETIIDEVLAIYMKAPKSFTREDVVEIHSHSGFVVLDRILSTVIDAGAVLAEPGEFSKRAFLNGRIDLTQAEAIIDLINAPCETAARIAGLQAAGEIKDVVENLSQTIIELQAKCEAVIEFSDDINQESIYLDIKGILEDIVFPDIRSLITRQRETAIFKDGLHLAIAGVPNVGKSSLLNQLVDKETAIVSELPGTTRDIVREYISISGVPVIIYDTAGIHDTDDPIESIGIEKAKKQMGVSDIVLWVFDGTRETRKNENVMVDETKNTKTIVVINKMDISSELSMAAIENNFPSYRCIRVSAKFGNNINELKKLIFKELMMDNIVSMSERVTPNLRQRKIFEKILQEAEPLFNKPTETPIDVLSEKLSRMNGLLGKISGIRSQEELYDSIFNQFCIGK